MTAVGVYVVTGDPVLKRALVGRIERARGFFLPPSDGSFDELGPGDLVLTTTADASPAFCSQLAAHGIHVVILAPVLREADRSRYTKAGAEYVAMEVDTAPLFDALRRFEPPCVSVAG